MDSANDSVPADPLPVLLAGIHAGVTGTLGMLAWFGLSAAWQRRSFWTAANLLASTFYGDAAIHAGFARSTVTGVALYLVLYGILGACFAIAVRSRVRGAGLALLGIVFAVGWYYLSFGVIFKKVSPLVALLHMERSTIVGHIIYGGLLGRFPAYVGRGGASPDVP
jgi:hypothetical protein